MPFPVDYNLHYGTHHSNHYYNHYQQSVMPQHPTLLPPSTSRPFYHNYNNNELGSINNVPASYHQQRKNSLNNAIQLVNSPSSDFLVFGPGGVDSNTTSATFSAAMDEQQQFFLQQQQNGASNDGIYTLFSYHGNNFYHTHHSSTGSDDYNTRRGRSSVLSSSANSGSGTISSGTAGRKSIFSGKVRILNLKNKYI